LQLRPHVTRVKEVTSTNHDIIHTNIKAIIKLPTMAKGKCQKKFWRTLCVAVLIRGVID